MGGTVAITSHRISVKGKPSLLRLSPSSSKESISLLSNEKSAILAAGKHVKVPAILAYGKKKVGRSHQSYLLLEGIRGAPFLPERDYRTAAHYLATLHCRTEGRHPPGIKKSPDAAAHFTRAASERFPLLRKLGVPASLRLQAKQLLSAAHKASSQKQEASCITLANGHPLPYNWLKTQHGLALSDWSHSSFTSPAADLCMFLSPFSLSWRSPSPFPLEAQSEFLSTYLSHFSGGQEQDILAQCSRASVPASAYLFLLGLTSPSPPRHFRNILFVKKAAAQAAQSFPP